MALTASEFLAQRMDQDKQGLQRAFEQEWSVVNRRYGPQTNDIQREAARQRALSGLHQKYASQAQKLLSGYEAKSRGFAEVDTMAESGMISANPEEVKMRMVLPPEMEKAAFPKEEEAADPMAEIGRFSTERDRVRSGLERFEREAPRTQRAPRFGFRRGSIETQGGGVLVVDEGYDETASKGKGGSVKVRRNATPDELREWAELTEHERQLTEAIEGIRKSEPMAARIRLAAARSRRMLNAGTFAEKATNTATEKTTLRQIDAETAQALYDEAGGDPAKARELARQRGFRF